MGFKKRIKIYTDGSYTPNKKGYVGMGFVCVKNDEIIYEKMFNKQTPLADEYRNVIAELYACMEAILYAYENNYNKITIYADYQGVREWFYGTWKRKNNITQLYHEWCNDMNKEIDIEIQWIKGHSNNEYNELADYLAKKSLELEDNN